jgi:hypothetical protein
MVNLRIFFLMAILLLPCAQAEDFPLGRLFMPPEKREELNIFRLQGEEPMIEQPKEAPPPPPNYIQFNGLIIRSDGQRTAWINGKQQAPAGVKVDLQAIKDNALPVYIVNGGDTVSLKPGQRLDTISGQRSENFNVFQ